MTNYSTKFCERVRFKDPLNNMFFLSIHVYLVTTKLRNYKSN